MIRNLLSTAIVILSGGPGPTTGAAHGASTTPAAAHLATTSALGTVATLIVVPVVVAVLTSIGTLIITRAGEAANRRRDRYAEAVSTLVAWAEFPYRVRRRTDDEPATLSGLASLGHDLQERLACHQAWIATEHPAVAQAYADARATINAAVGPAVTEAWNSQPVTTATGMNLNGWGPGAVSVSAIGAVQARIADRFGWRRVRAWVFGPTPALPEAPG